MIFTVALTPATPFTLDLATLGFHPGDVENVLVHNVGTGIVYWGDDLPTDSFVIACSGGPAGVRQIAVPAEHIGKIQAGMSADEGSGGIDIPDFVTGVFGTYITVRKALLAAFNGGVTFTNPVTTDTTGIPLAVGAQKEWTGDGCRAWLNGKKKFVVAAATSATIRISVS